MKNVLFVILLCGGCAEVAPVNATLNVNTIKRHDEEKLGPADVTVAVEVVTPQNVKQYKGVTVTARWRERNQSQANTGTSQGASNSTVERSADVPILPLPLFVVRIVNQSHAAVSFGSAQFTLEDGK